MRFFIRLSLLFLIGIAVLALSALIAHKYWLAHHQSGPLTGSQDFSVQTGNSLGQISQKLENSGIIDDSLSFQLIARIQGVSNQLKAGNYRFPKKVSADKVLEMLIHGKTHLYSITIPEGMTSQQITARLMANNLLSGNLSTPIPEASIFPETYHFEKNMLRQKLVQLMQQKWQIAVEKLWHDRSENYPIESLEKVLILASIVEKEAVRKDEMPIIAGVFHNRLKKNMRLQSDPTVIYALSDGLGKMDRTLTRKDWKFEHKHNTYQNKGLPPTAIAHPSLAAVKATLAPAETDYIFFVADGEGGHRFSKNLTEHNRNVAKLNKLRKQLRDKK